MLLGAKLNIYTDHQNLTHRMTMFTTQRVLRWRLLLEDFDTSFHYKKGDTNYIADALSQVPTSTMEREEHNDSRTIHNNINLQGNNSKLEDAHVNKCSTSILQANTELLDCLLSHPKFDDNELYPTNFGTIRKYQEASKELIKRVKQNPSQYTSAVFGDTKLLCYKGDNNEPKIYIPDNMINKLAH